MRAKLWVSKTVVTVLWYRAIRFVRAKLWVSKVVVSVLWYRAIRFVRIEPSFCVI